MRRILVSSGGGGNYESAQKLRSEIDTLLQLVRKFCAFPIHVTQVSGPRLPKEGALQQVDEMFDPGSQLNELFSRFDLVISTAGYNSVLELAELDVPVLLVPIMRSLDDQVGRSKKWATELGMMHIEGTPVRSARWIAQTLENYTRRASVRLDSDGAMRCANLILELMQ
jgi:predicted glycosyltransferase